MRGDATISVLFTLLHGQATGHPLHTEVVPAWLLVCGGDSCDTLSHYLQCRCIRVAVDFAVGLTSRAIPVDAWMGLSLAATEMQRSQVAQRVAVAPLTYHETRAKWRAAGENPSVAQGSDWGASLGQVAFARSWPQRRSCRGACLAGGARRSNERLWTHAMATLARSQAMHDLLRSGARWPRRNQDIAEPRRTTPSGAPRTPHHRTCWHMRCAE